MGKTQELNQITGRYPLNSQLEITIGDGVTSSDEYIAASGVLNTALTNALADIKASGGTITILPGEYTISSSLTINNSNLVLRGSGYNTHISVGDFDITLGVGASIVNVRIENARYSNNYGPGIVLGSTTGSVSTSVIQDNWFEDSIGFTDPNANAPVAPNYLFQFDNTTPFSNSGTDNPTYVGVSVGSVFTEDWGNGNWPLTGAIQYVGDKAINLGVASNVGVVYITNSAGTRQPIFLDAIGQPFSIEAWILKTVVGPIREVFVQTSNYNAVGEGFIGLGFTTTENRIRLTLNSSSNTNIRRASTNQIPSRQWTHVIATYDGTTADETGIKIYINGVEESSYSDAIVGPLTGAFGFDADTVVSIGAAWNTAAGDATNITNYTGRFDGFIDNIAVYDVALSASEIGDRYDSFIGLYPIVLDHDPLTPAFSPAITQEFTMRYPTITTSPMPPFPATSGSNRMVPAADGEMSFGFENIVGYGANKHGQFFDDNNNTVYWMDNGAGVVAVPTTESAATAFSVDAWIWIPSGVTGPRTIVGQRGLNGVVAQGWQLYKITADYHISLSMFNGVLGDAISVTSSEEIVPETWVHVCVTYDGSGLATGLNLYFDGKDVTGLQVFTGATPLAGTWTGDSVFAVGNIYDDNSILVPNTIASYHASEWWIGAISNVGVWNGTALTAANVQDRYYHLSPSKDIDKYSTSGILTNGNISTTRLSGL